MKYLVLIYSNPMTREIWEGLSSEEKSEGLDAYRDLAPQVLAAVVRHHGDFDACEDAVQEALLAAATRWPLEGVPDDPRAWLITVASRRRIERWRQDEARRRREEAVVASEVDPPVALPDRDDTLTLLMLCCHPALTPSSQVALTMRAVGGLATAEIARAFLVPEATMGQRISRTKARIREAGAVFQPPPPEERAERITAVLRVLYLVFNEGYAASAGPDLQRVELSTEAVRLARQLRARLPEDGEVAGLLALMLLTDARRAARTDTDGGLVPLAEQDRTRWDQDAIADGVDLVTRALASGPLGPYQLQAAIAAIHAEAACVEDTDWRRILTLYDLLHALDSGPTSWTSRVTTWRPATHIAWPPAGPAVCRSSGISIPARPRRGEMSRSRPQLLRPY